MVVIIQRLRHVEVFRFSNEIVRRATKMSVHLCVGRKKSSIFCDERLPKKKWHGVMSSKLDGTATFLLTHGSAQEQESEHSNDMKLFV